MKRHTISIMKCFACELPAAHDGFCEGCYDDLCMGADDALSVAEKLTGIIDAQNVELVAYERIVSELNAALAAQPERMAALDLIDQRDRIAALEFDNATYKEIIAELEQQSRSIRACAAIDRASEMITQLPNGRDYAEGCKP